MDAAISSYRAYRPSLSEILKIYPRKDDSTLNRDPRVISILLRYLRRPENYKAIYDAKKTACIAYHCCKDHAIGVGLGDMGFKNAFGKVLFVCHRPYKGDASVELDYKYQLTEAEKAAVVYEILALQPPAILTASAREGNRERWRALIPYRLKPPTDEVEKKLAQVWKPFSDDDPVALANTVVAAIHQPAPIPTKPAKRSARLQSLSSRTTDDSTSGSSNASTHNSTSKKRGRGRPSRNGISTKRARVVSPEI